MVNIQIANALLFDTHKACQEWPCFGKIQFGEKTPRFLGLVCKTVGGFVIVVVLIVKTISQDVYQLSVKKF